MAIFEFICPVTGEVARHRFRPGDNTPEAFYSAGATREQIDAYEKANPKAAKLRRHPHQGAV